MKNDRGFDVILTLLGTMFLVLHTVRDVRDNPRVRLFVPTPPVLTCLLDLLNGSWNIYYAC